MGRGSRRARRSVLAAPESGTVKDALSVHENEGDKDDPDCEVAAPAAAPGAVEAEGAKETVEGTYAGTGDGPEVGGGRAEEKDEEDEEEGSGAKSSGWRLMYAMRRCCTHVKMSSRRMSDCAFAVDGSSCPDAGVDGCIAGERWEVEEADEGGSDDAVDREAEEAGQCAEFGWDGGGRGGGMGDAVGSDGNSSRSFMSWSRSMRSSAQAMAQKPQSESMAMWKPYLRPSSLISSACWSSIDGRTVIRVTGMALAVVVGAVAVVAVVAK